MTTPQQPPPAPTVKTASGHVYRFRGEGTGAFQRFAWNFGRLLSRIISTLYFRLRATGQHQIPKTGGILMVTNHQSYLDPWLIGIAPSRQLHYMARDTLFKGGLLTWLMELWNTFPVKRGAADLTAIRTATERLDKGFVVNVFPEGTRSEDGSIAPVAPGVSLILSRTKADISILPVIIDGAFDAWPRHAKAPRFHPIRIHYGTPIPRSEWLPLSPDELAWRIRRELVQLQQRIGSRHAAISRERLARDLAQAAAAPPRSNRRRRASPG